MAFARAVSPDRRGAAAYRASANPQPRHDRRQPRACRSGVGVAGDRCSPWRARFRAQAAKGERWIEAPDFFVGGLTTALKPDEMLVEVELPMPKPRTGSCFMEIARRRGDFAIVGVAATMTLGGGGQMRRGAAGADAGWARRPSMPAPRPSGVSTGQVPTEEAVRDVAGVRAGHDRSRRQHSRQRRLSAPYRRRSHRARAASWPTSGCSDGY